MVNISKSYISASHAGNRGSSPRGTTKIKSIDCKAIPVTYSLQVQYNIIQYKTCTL